MNFISSLWVVVLPVSTLFYSQSHAFCFEEAGAVYGISPTLLKAMAMVESSLKPAALNRGHIKNTSSIDIGLMQINSRWLRQEPFRSLGYQQAHLMDPCTNVKVGAWVLANNFKVHGATWEAVGAYNAACTQLKGAACVRARNSYEWKVYRAMRKAA